MEQEHARLRRMAEEHQANIHREILEVNRRNSIEIAQSLYEMKAKAEAEVKNQQMLVPLMSHIHTYIVHTYIHTVYTHTYIYKHIHTIQYIANLSNHPTLIEPVP